MPELNPNIYLGGGYLEQLEYFCEAHGREPNNHTELLNWIKKNN